MVLLHVAQIGTKTDGTQVAITWVQGVEMLRGGMTPADVAEELGGHPHSVDRWMAIDIFFERMVRFRYGAPFEADKDLSDKILAIIHRLGKAGYLILNKVEDSME